MAVIGFKEWSRRYNELRNIVDELLEKSELTDILFFNEVAKHELLVAMKKASDSGFKKRDVNEFKKTIQKFNFLIVGEN